MDFVEKCKFNMDKRKSEIKLIELLDVVDEENHLTGKVEDKEIIHKRGLWHREVAAWIMNNKGEILIQKRAKTKKQNPNKWSLTAGHIDAGESAEDGMHREVLEEIGVDIQKFSRIKIAKIQEEHPNSNTTNNYFSYIFFVKVNYNLEDYKIQEEELSELKYITIEELEQIIKNKDDNYTFSKRDNMSEIIKYLYKEREKLSN